MPTKKNTEEANNKRTGSAKDVGAVVNAIQILRHLANAEGPEGATA
ncbi:IclR family transcriptional regulator, partial [Pseudomonas sp. ATCC 13867]